MASKIEYQDLEVEGTVKANVFSDGVLKNSGFEVVAELPTTGLFEGRQVFFQNRAWVYSDGWQSSDSPVYMPGSSYYILQTSIDVLNSKASYIEVVDKFCQIPEILNKSFFLSNNKNCVKKNDRLYEIIDNETGTITVKSDIVQPVVGQTLRYTAINPNYDVNELFYRIYSNGNVISSTAGVYISQNRRSAKSIYKIEYYIYSNATGDGDATNRDNYVWKTVFEKELRQASLYIYPLSGILYSDKRSEYIKNIRISITPTTVGEYEVLIHEIDCYYKGDKHPQLIEFNRLINYDAVIEPTQTSATMKSIPWILQYLTQGINWLKVKLANGSMSLNSTTVKLGDSAVLPWYVDYNDVNYPARLRDNWLQIYRNGVWGNLMYLSGQEAIQPTQVVQITSFDNLDWYNEQVSEYEVDNNTTQSILAGTTLPAAALMNCLAEQLTLNFYPISGKKYGKGSLDSLISDLQGKGFSVFVENDLDAILASGSDYLVRIKISKVPTPKAIIECYMSR